MQESPEAVSAPSTVPSVDSDTSSAAGPSTASSTSWGSGRVSLASTGRGDDVRDSKFIKEGEVVDLTTDSDAEDACRPSGPQGNRRDPVGKTH